MSVPDKSHGRILIVKVRSLTEGLIGEEQCGFRFGRGSIDQVFVMIRIKFVCCIYGLRKGV